MIRKTLQCICLSLAASVAMAGDAGVKSLTQDAFLALPQQGADAPFVLDVRTPEEYASGYVPGAANIPYDQIASRLSEVPKDKEVVLYCRSGRRAQMAAEVLASNGYKDLAHLQGDILAWTESGRPVTKPSDPAECIAALKSGEARATACAGN
jgi:rhodanese-related sulfurtransferase